MGHSAAIGIDDLGVARLAGGLLFATDGDQRDISRQTVGGQVAVSTVKDNGDLDAGPDRQIVIQGGKGQGRGEIQLFAIKRLDPTRERVEREHPAATKIDKTVTLLNVGKIGMYACQHRVQPSKRTDFIAKAMDGRRRKAQVDKGAPHKT